MATAAAVPLAFAPDPDLFERDLPLTVELAPTSADPAEHPTRQP
jgi:hypothetical protein